MTAFRLNYSMATETNSLQDLLDFLNGLERVRIQYRLSHSREEAIMVEIAVPGERWEVEFFADGELEVERFGVTGEGVVSGNEAREWVKVLFAKYSD